MPHIKKLKKPVASVLFLSLAACSSGGGFTPKRSAPNNDLASMVINDTVVTEPSDITNPISLATNAPSDKELVYTISGGNDQTVFVLDSATGELTINTDNNGNLPVDSDGDYIYDLIINISDGETSVERTISVSLATAVETNTAPVIESPTSFNIDENGTSVSLLSASDADGNKLTFSLIGGNDVSAFSLENSTGELSFITAPDAENPTDSDGNNIYEVTVAVTDGMKTTEQTLSIVVADANDIPAFTSSPNVSISEDQSEVYTVGVLDGDGDALTFSISGADASAFTLSNTGLLSFISAPDFEMPADSNTDNNYILDISVSDGNGGVAVQTVTVSVNNVNETPSFISVDTVTVDENQSGVLLTANAVDPDGETLTYSINGGVDAAAFSINNGGELSFSSPPNFESPTDSNSDNSYVVDIVANDGNGGSATQTVTVNVTNVNEAPAFTSATSANAAENQTTAYTAAANDPDNGDTLSYSISGGSDALLFSINSATGELSFAAAPDFESPIDSNADNSYLVDLTVSDNNGSSAVQTVAINVTNVNEMPSLTTTSTASIQENQTAVLTATASDPDTSDTLTFSISGGDDAAAFSINGATGELTFASAPDYENPLDFNTDNTYQVELTVTDGNGGSDAQIVNVDVTDESQISIDVSYPTPNANLRKNTTVTTVTGNIYDAEDGVVDFDDVNYIDINGTLATQDIADPSRWSVQVSVPQKTNKLSVSSESNSGATDSANLDVLNEIVFSEPNSLEYDPSNNRILIADSNLGAIIAIDTRTGERSVISSATVGSGNSLSNIKGISLDSANNRVFALTSRCLSVDLTTGNRTSLSLIAGAYALEYDSVNDRTLVAAASIVDSLYSVDATTGATSTIADGTTGTGATLNFTYSHIALDAPNDRAFITQPNTNSVIEVDLTNGNRTTLSDSSNGTGTNFITPRGVVLDSSNNRLLVSDIDADAIFAVDLTTGNRTIISDTTTGDFTNLSNPKDLGLDTTNNRVLVVDDRINGTVAVDLSDGTRSAVYEVNSGNGRKLAEPLGITMDESNNQLLVVERYIGVAAYSEPGWQGVVAVDMNSGDRTVISDPTTGSGTNFDAAFGIAYDQARNRALVTDDNLNAVIAVDMATGNRSVLSDDSNGTGPSLNNPTGIFVDSANNRALVLLLENAGIIAVDLDTGNRTTISATGTGSGPDFVGRMHSMAFDASNNRAYAISIDAGLYAVDLTNGDRTIVSDGITGAGPLFVDPQAVSLDIDNNRAIVVDKSSIILVDLTTGDRSALAEHLDTTTTVYDGWGFGVPYNLNGVAYDSTHKRIFTTNKLSGAVFVTDINSGEQAVMSK